MTAGSGFRRKEGRDGGINRDREKWAGRRDLRTLLWTLKVRLSVKPFMCP